MKTRITGTQLHARAQAGLRRDLIDMYTDMHSEMAGVLQRYGTGPDQTLPRKQWDNALEDVGLIHRKYFIGTTGRRAFDEKDMALTPYAKILQRWYIYVVVGAVRLDRAWMKRHIPEDVYNWLARTRRNSFQVPDQQQEAVSLGPYAKRPDETDDEYRKRLLNDLNVVHSSPLAEIDPSRQWVPMDRWTDENGYRLSDRLWRGEARAREKIDSLLMKGLRDTTGSLKLSKLLFEALLPTRTNVKTNKPYGTRASYDAMRLARTEITRAYNQAAYTSALLNPYVNQIDVARSASGDRNCPICPQHATIGIDGNRVRPPYDQNDAHVGPFHPHCLCSIRPVPSDTPEAITQQIRALMEFDPSIEPAPTAATDNLINALLGAYLTDLWRRGAA